MIHPRDAEILATFSGRCASIAAVVVADAVPLGRQWRFAGHDLAAAKRAAATYADGWVNARIYQRTADEWSEVAS